MTDDTYDNDRIDERVRQLATDHYNPRQGSVPREAIWASVAAARRAARAAEGATVIPLRARQRVVHWRWAVALAAGLVFGVVIDRAVVGREQLPTKTIAVTAETPSVVRNESVPIITPAPTQSMASATPSATRNPGRPTPRAGTVSPAPDVAPLASAPTGERSLYHVAAMQTLVQAEALLTTYRRADDGQRDAVAMQQAARWSRDVLSSTRLLLDSPAAGDPRFRQLLSDLELVLAQIVQLSGAPLQAGERELIERAMRERDLLPRLRSAVPAGATS